MTESGGVERVLGRIDFARGLGGLLLLAVVGVAAVLAGGLIGWIVGVVILAICLALLIALVRRRD